ncbi:SMC-Scp complex subunit ScpB [Candidatus Woesearchaeota archaeon]|nr:SMC-Scp complex subunit ScpB [Candidatus Woesearchaeota archaeon]
MVDVKKEVESLLFSSGRVMTEDDLADLTGSSKKDVRKALESLKKEYDERDTSLALMESGEGWKLNVREQYVNLVTKIVADTELPFPILETLSIVAYKAPVTQAEVVRARGTNAYEHIQALIDAGFIERKKKGRSFQVGLTQKFFEYFDVPGEKSLKQLLKDVKPGEPAPSRRKKLGKLDVVELPEGSKDEQKSLVKGKEGSPHLGEFEVVDVAPEKPKEALGRDGLAPDDDFLKDIDAKIGQLSQRNDELDQDESFKRPDLDAEAGVEAEGSDDASQELVAADDKAAPVKSRSKDIFGDGDDGDEEEEKDKPKDPLAEDEDKLEI